MAQTIKARLSFTNDVFLKATLRGHTNVDYPRAFVRVKGKTISGWLSYRTNGVAVFFERSEGSNVELLQQLRRKANAA